MDIRAQLLTAHSRANADTVLRYVMADPGRVPALLDVFLGDDYRSVQRAAMVVGDLGRARPDWLRPYHGRLIAAATHPLHPAVVRNVLRYFSELPLATITEAAAGPLLDLAYRHFENPQTPVGIRVFAMQVVANFTTAYPELIDEVRAIIDLTLAEGATPGFRSRGSKILRQLREGG